MADRDLRREAGPRILVNRRQATWTTPALTDARCFGSQAQRVLDKVFAFVGNEGQLDLEVLPGRADLHTTVEFASAFKNSAGREAAPLQVAQQPARRARGLW